MRKKLVIILNLRKEGVKGVAGFLGFVGGGASCQARASAYYRGHKEVAEVGTVFIAHRFFNSFVAVIMAARCVELTVYAGM